MNTSRFRNFMRKISLVCIFALLFTTVNFSLNAFLGGNTVEAASTSYQTDFSKGSGEWKVEMGSWAVENGEYSTAGTADMDIASTGSSTWGDYDVQTAIKLVNSGTMAGLYFRYTDLSNCYFVHIADANPNIYLYKRVGGAQTLLTQVNVGTNFTLNTWYTLKVRVVGSSISVYLNGSTTPVISLTDTSLTQGKIALQASRTGGVDAHFDNIQVIDTSEPILYSTDFSSSAGWSVASGTGAVESGEYSLTGNAAAFNGDDWTDYEFKTDVKMMNSGDGAGLYVRYKDSSNFYLVHIVAASSTMYLYKQVNGTMTLLTSANIGTTIYPNTWYTLKVRVAGSNIKAYVGSSNTPVIDVNDTSQTFGKIGLWTYNGYGAAHSHFDNVSVKDLVTYLYKTDFNDGQLSDWDFNTGTDTAPQSWNVFAGKLYATSFAGSMIDAMVGQDFWTDYEAKTDLMFTDTTVDDKHEAGMMVRYTSPTSYYYAIIDNSTGILSLYKNLGTSWPTLQSVNLSTYGITIKKGAWYTLRVKCTGANIKVYLEQKDKASTPLIDYTDNSNPYLKGKIGLKSWSIATDPKYAENSFGMAFDNVEVVTTETHKKSGYDSYMLKSDFEINASEWTAGSGTCAVENEEYSLSGSLGETYAGDSSWTDYILNADFCMKNAGERAGLIVRSNGAGTHYLVHVTEGVTPENGYNLYIYKAVNNTYTLLESIDVGIDFIQNVWYNMQVKVQGDLIQVYFFNKSNPYDQATVNIKDSSITSGKIGLRAWNTTTGHTHFDNVYVTQIPALSYPATTPSIVTTNYITDEKVVASFNVTNYGAVAGDIVDDTAAFQAAINAAYKAGGAVVWVPSGQYSIYGSVEVLPGVTLRGDWKSPDNGGLGLGTVIRIYGGKDNQDAKPAFIIRTSAGIKGMTFWYPEQDVNNIHAYPWAIWLPGSIIHGAGAFQTVENVTLINPFKGIKVSGAYNFAHYIKNVYGTPLKQGLFIDSCYDVSPKYNVKFAPNYWRDCGFAGAPTGSAETTLRNWTRNNGEAFVTARDDGSIYYNLKAESYNIGFRIQKYSEWTPWFTVYGLDVDDCNYGICKYTGFANVLVSNSDIVANVEGIYISDGTMYVNTTSITSGGRAVDQQNGSSMRLQNVTFRNWGSSTQAVYCASGSLTVEGCTFQQSKPHILFDTNCTGGAALDNTFTGSPQITKNSTSDIKIDTTTVYNFVKMPTSGHVWGTVRKPSTSNFYNVKASPYNAYGDGIHDDTTAIQNALTAAGNAGGGTVYLPSGDYRINTHLSVPSNVELRGIADTPHFTITHNNSTLLAYEGKNNPTGTPLISLAANAGVKGLNIWYPEQIMDVGGQSFYSYPYAIQGTGQGVYVQNVTVGNGYQGIDFGTYNTSNHFIQGFNGSFIKQGVYIGNNSTANSEGWIQDCLINVIFNMDSVYQSPERFWIGAFFQQRQNLTAYKFGKTVNEHALNAFAYAPKYGLQFVSEAAGKCTGTFIGSYSDLTRDAVWKIDDADNVDIYDCHGITGAFSSDVNGAMRSIETASTFTGTARFFNLNLSGNDGGWLFNGGNVTLQGIELGITSGTNPYFTVNGGTFNVNNIWFPKNTTPHYLLGSGITSAKIIGTGVYQIPINVVDNSGGKATIANNFTRN